jgi:SAM-dependent methyltransferase
MPEFPPSQPLHTQKPTTRFSDRAADYAAHRPSYPAQAVDCILGGLGDPSALVIADIGAGTGISSRLLADRGASILAVEPNAAMREGAERHPRVRLVEGTAEKTTLPDRSCDAVVCAQAFHWFDHPKAFAEFTRILKPGGRLAIVWNTRDQSDPFTAEYSRLMVVAAQGDPAGERKMDARVAEGAGAFTPFEKKSFPFAQVLTEEGLIGRAMSASYAPKIGEKYTVLERGLRQLHRRFARDGIVRLAYSTEVFLAVCAG